MRFMIDAQLPLALARWNEARGFAAEHVFDLGMACAADSEIWTRASEAPTVIVTKDEDFAFRRHFAAPGPPAIVWLRFGNTKTRVLLTKFEAAWGQIIPALERGEVLIEIG